MSAGACNTSTTGEHRLLAYRVERLEEAHKEAVAEIRDAVQSIDKSLQALAVVQEQHGATRESLLHATKLIQVLAEKVNRVEIEMPMLRMVRGWILTGMVGVAGAVGYALIALVVRP